MTMMTVKTFSGLEFGLRRAGHDDATLLSDFWRHISPANRPARYIGMDDPAEPAASVLDGQSGRTATFLAFGGNGAVIAVGILVADVDGHTARVMVFTRDEITNHGISWAVLEALLTHARQAGIIRVTSVFSVADARAIRLERKMGFSEADFPGHPDYRLLEWNLEQPAVPQRTRVSPENNI